MNYINLLLSTGNMEPHSEHFLGGHEGLMWFLILGNVLIAIFYMLLPVQFLYLYFKRPDFPFRPFLVLLPLFVFLCGLTHIVMVITFWRPLYYLSATIDFLTGVVSFITFLYIIPNIPKALSLVGNSVLAGENKKLEERITLHRKDKATLAQKNLELKRISEGMQRKNDELTKLNKQMVAQELRMISIKEELKKFAQL